MSETRTYLYLIRHGEAISNVEPIIGGMKGDKGLTALGVAQVEALRDRLSVTQEIEADVFISSPLARAYQTAEIIQPVLNQPIIIDDDVQELKVGDADGMHVAVYREKYGLPDFRIDPFRLLAPGGENWPQFMLRVSRTINRITREYVGKRIVIVCHGGFIDGSMITFLHLSSFSVPPVEFHTLNTSITQWDCHHEEGQPPHWRLIRYNDAIHIHTVGRSPHVNWNSVPLPENLDGE
jgi:probable phosphoglycerate mutase